MVFRGSSAVEQPAVNRLVVGSNPTRGANCGPEKLWPDMGDPPVSEQTAKALPSGDPVRSAALEPWRPMTRPIDIKHLGKLAEETNELGSAISRCIIQGIDECDPVTGKPNRQWLQDEIADVLANIELVREHFGLDSDAVSLRAEKKKRHLRAWHSMIDDRK
jgi:NTP pyrophosphatase (non-canonical NTP hydrolase)